METKLKKYNFQKLTPVKNVELKIYKDALDFVFQEDDLKNVAITGPYSAGKSSVVETYKNDHPSLNFLHISLAHFEATGLDSDNGNEAKDDKNNDAALEGKILNQLLHQVDPDKIPQTLFKVKRKISRRKMILTSAMCSLFVILMTYILGYNSWNDYIENLSNAWLKKTLAFTTNDISVIEQCYVA
jgi:hypothetical protein